MMYSGLKESRYERFFEEEKETPAPVYKTVHYNMEDHEISLRSAQRRREMELEMRTRTMEDQDVFFVEREPRVETVVRSPVREELYVAKGCGDNESVRSFGTVSTNNFSCLDDSDRRNVANFFTDLMSMVIVLKKNKDSVYESCLRNNFGLFDKLVQTWQSLMKESSAIRALPIEGLNVVFKHFNLDAVYDLEYLNKFCSDGFFTSTSFNHFVRNPYHAVKHTVDERLLTNEEFKYCLSNLHTLVKERINFEKEFNRLRMANANRIFSIFNMVDRGGHGFLDVQILGNYFSEIGASFVQTEDIRSLITMFDRDCDERIYFQDFKKIMSE